MLLSEKKDLRCAIRELLSRKLDYINCPLDIDKTVSLLNYISEIY